MLSKYLGGEKKLFPEKYFSVGQVQITATATFATVLMRKFATSSVVK
jgi:hypothetical protein